MMFQIGQKVVCIKSSWRYDQYSIKGMPPKILPVKDGIYVIADFDHFNGELYLILKETDIHYSWISYGFRPLIERKTDISVFKKLETGVSGKVREDA